MTTNPIPVSSPLPSRPAGSRRTCCPRYLAGAFCLLIVATVATLPNLAAEEPQSHQLQTPKTVMLTIDYGDGVQKRFTKIPWKGGMTILDAMQAAERHKRGIKYVVHGTGPTTLLTRIDDLKNEGGSGLNWIFRVNKKLGDSSFAVVKLKPGDDILWKFDEYR